MAVPPAISIQDELRRRLNSGQKISAIKLVCESHECTLAEAKKIIEAFTASESLGGAQPQGDTVQSAAEPSDQRITDEQLDEVLDLLETSGRLAAVKSFRSHSGLSLKESKEFIENLEASSRGSAVKSESSGCLSVLLIFFTLAIAATTMAARSEW